jgi:hypothetical protein
MTIETPIENVISPRALKTVSRRRSDRRWPMSNPAEDPAITVAVLIHVPNM